MTMDYVTIITKKNYLLIKQTKIFVYIYPSTRVYVSKELPFNKTKIYIDTYINPSICVYVKIYIYTYVCKSVHIFK